MGKKENMTVVDLGAAIFIISLMVLFILIGPFLAILSLNYLFKLKIPYNIWSFLSIMFLQMYFSTSAVRTRSNQ